jgi:hypothetical protein
MTPFRYYSNHSATREYTFNLRNFILVQSDLEGMSWVIENAGMLMMGSERGNRVSETYA